MSRIKYLIFFIPLIFILSCTENQKEEDKILNGLAEKYFRLGLRIGRYDPDFV